MKKTLRQLLLAVALLGVGPFTLAVLAEDTPASNPPPPAEPDKAAVQAPASPAPEAAEPQHPATPVPPAPAAETASTPAPATGELRRIDAPAPEASTADVPAPTKHGKNDGRRNVNPQVSIFGNSLVRKDETADSSVAVFGNSTNEGSVRDAVVAVFGNARSTGPVGDAVVAVLGNVYVDDDVQDVVAVLGNVELGPNARVRGDVVTVGGALKRDPSAVIKGDIPTVGFGPIASSAFDGLHAYLQQCVYKLRPLGFGEHLWWAWAIAFGFLAFYLLIALLFRGGVEKCVETFETRPGSSIIAAFLMVLLTPVLVILLAITVVGLPCLMVAALFAKTVMLAWIGRQITKLFGSGPWSHPVFAVLIGGLIALALYTIPVVGFIVYKILGVIGLGVIVYTLVRASKKEKRPAPPTAPTATPMTTSGVTPVAAPVAPIPAAVPPVSISPEAASFAAATPGASAGFAFPVEPAGAVPSATIPPGAAVPPLAGAVVTPPPVVVEALPRAGFWIRTGALAIDIILIAILLSFAPRFLHLHFVNGVLPIAAAYGAILWKLKGTTIGGIICGLRVVRIDNREMDWATAIVRALACFVSLFVAGLGFIWVVIDDEKQSWHDKIAGTTVVFARGNMSLI